MSIHWVTVVGLVLAILAGLASAFVTGAIAVIVGVFALASDEGGGQGALVAGIVALVWLLGVAAFVVAIVLLFRRRGWARILLAVLSAATGALAVFAESFPVAGALGIVAVVLLFLPPSNRWFARSGLVEDRRVL